MLFTCGDAGRNFSEQVNKELSGQAQENGRLEYAFGRVGESADAEGPVSLSGRRSWRARFPGV